MVANTFDSRNDFTAEMIRPGIADDLVHAAYDLHVRTMLNNSPVFDQFVTVTPDDVSMQGSSQTITKQAWFDDATIKRAATPLGELEDVKATKMPKGETVTLTPKEYGFAVTSTRYLENRVMAPFQAHKANMIADVAAKVIDHLIQAAIEAEAPKYNVTGELTSQVSSDAALLLVDNSAPTWDGANYLAIAHPNTIADLRDESGPGSWLAPREYQNSEQLNWLPSEVGVFKGVRYISNLRVNSEIVDGKTVYNTVFMGADALAKSVVTPLEVVAGPQVDMFKRLHPLGFYMDIDYKVFEKKAILVVKSTASERDLLKTVA